MYSYYIKCRSLSVFQKLSTEFPNAQGAVSALVFKEQLSALNKAKPEWYSNDEQAIIKKTLDQYKKSYSIVKETNDYYLIDIPINGTPDVKFLGKFSALTPIQPIVFSKKWCFPYKSFFQVA
ncbi:MAG: hypothetical protein PHY93_16260 [Bacteriovorax sp.]|nr:hypothetical protein [Bacteriovorax sp.]